MEQRATSFEDDLAVIQAATLIAEEDLSKCEKSLKSDLMWVAVCLWEEMKFARLAEKASVLFLNDRQMQAARTAYLNVFKFSTRIAS